MKTVLKVLLEAVKTIEQFGWIQGEGGTDIRGYCMLGAMHSAALGWNIFNKCKLPVAKVLNVSTHSIDKWNDTPGRTKEEVLAVFRKAIENERISPSD